MKKKTKPKKMVLSKKARMRFILETLPEGLTMEDVKFGFVDKVMNFHEGNLTRAADELQVSYRTLCDWVHGNYPTTCESRGRGNPGKRDY